MPLDNQKEFDKFNKETREMFISVKDYTGWYYTISVFVGVCIGMRIGKHICDAIINIWLTK